MCKMRVYVGTYTISGKGKGGDGIYVYDLNLENGMMEQVSVYTECQNPSFLAFSGDRLYACEELHGASSIVAFTINEDGTLSYRNRVKTEESGMCHVAVWPNSDYIVASNFNSGTLLNCSLQPNGDLGEVKEFIQHEGSGPHRMQNQAHVHSATLYPTGDRVLVCDLGNDTLKTYVLEPALGKLTCIQTTKLASGSGPRHAAFSKDGQFVTVASQLGSTLTTFRCSEGVLTDVVSELSMLPDDYDGAGSAADIHYSPDGKYLYASNRVHNSIVVCDVASDGKLSNRRWFPCYGDSPRNFCITPDGKFALIANQRSGDLVSVPIDKETGNLLDKTCCIKIPEVVFVSPVV